MEAAKAQKNVKSQTPLAHGVGRRKSSVARVWLYRGNGSIKVNGKDFKRYFDTDIVRMTATTPFALFGKDRYSAEVNVQGGGLNAQADAIKLGIARALVDADQNAHSLLREYGLLTVDARVKERKKYGQKAARRKFQFVKR